MAHVERRAYGAERVVLVHARNPEGGGDGVADELLHRPAMVLDRRAHLGEPALRHRPHRLRIEPLGKRRRADEIGEEERGGLTCEPLHRPRVRRALRRVIPPLP